MNFRIIKYDVSVSFAEEDRPFVERVVRLLKEKNVKVFYDDDERTWSLGHNLAEYLDEVYRKKSRFCVIFISKHYAGKQWTQYEKERAQARAIYMEKKVYILPYRLDDTEIKGIEASTAYLSFKTHDEHQLVAAILANVEKRRPLWLRGWHAGRSFLSKKTGMLSLATAVTGTAAFGLWDKLTPIDKLTERLYERSKKSYHGAICNNNTFSKSHGRGTCSHNGGVHHYVDTVVYTKTLDQCKKEAEEVSWLSN